MWSSAPRVPAVTRPFPTPTRWSACSSTLVPLRVRVDPARSLDELLKDVRAQQIGLREHEHTPLAKVQGWSEVPRGRGLFDSIVVYENHTLDTTLRALSVDGSRPRVLLSRSDQLPAHAHRLRRRRDAHTHRERPPARRGRADLSNAGAPRDPSYRNAGLRGTEAQRAAAPHRLRSEARSRVGRGCLDLSSRSLPARALRGARTDRSRAGGGGVRGRVADLRRARPAGERAGARAALARGRAAGSWSGCGPSARSTSWSAILGILKAGGAYLPLDPAYPQGARRVHARRLAGAVVVTESSFASDFEASGAELAAARPGARGGRAGAFGAMSNRATWRT